MQKKDLCWEKHSQSIAKLVIFNALIKNLLQIKNRLAQ